MKSLKKYFRISWADRWLLIEAAISLSLVRLATRLVPFKRLAPRLGKPSAAPEVNLDLVSETRANRVGWAINAVAKRTPWKSTCLVKSIAAKRILQRSRIPSTL